MTLRALTPLSMAFALACCSRDGAHPGASLPSPASADARPAVPTEAPLPESIGSATMRADGTIVLELRATDGHGTVGDALLEYPPGHPEYAGVLEHLGGLEPGESKPVAPWPDD